MAANLRLQIALDASGIMQAKLSNDGPAVASGFRLCFSLIAPGEVHSGCKMHLRHGGYCELGHPDDAPLETDQSWEFAFGYRENRHRPLNVSWGPERPYLVSGEKVLPVAVELDFGASPPLEPIPQPAELDLKLAPTPQSFVPSEGGSCKLGQGIGLPQPLSVEVAESVAAVQELGLRCGLPQLFGDRGIEMEIKLDAARNASSYQIIFQEKRIEITAADELALRHALISLLQLSVTEPAGVPCGKLDDEPRFCWRGLHFDCARHYYSVPSICRLLDLLALLKFNRFHWHLIDDESFRLELESLPQLAERTALRGPGCLVPGVFGAGGEPVGGTYTKEDVRTIVTHAKKLGIEVMPEIEIPAHAWAILQVMPEMRDAEDQSREESVQGYFENTLNPAKEATWDFLAKVIPELCTLFPFKVIHLGCDEMPPGVWTASPALEKYKAEHKLADAIAVQEHMMQQAAAIVKSCGARPAAWEEAAYGPNGGIGHDALIFSWSGQTQGLAAARNGYEVVMAPAQHTYLDMAPNAAVDQRGMNWAALVSLAETTNWEPVPVAEPELEKQIMGVHGALWSETVLQDGDHEQLIAPRILGIAESGWATASNCADGATLHALSNAWQPLFAAMSWRCNQNC